MTASFEEPDLNSLTVAELKGLLDEQGIEYGSSDLKADLIEKLGG